MNVAEMISEYRRLLNTRYTEGELAQLIFLVFEHVMGFLKTDLVMKRNEEIPEVGEKELMRILSELKDGKPVQYVLGEAWFHGMKLKVNEQVLIPRQETEELVDWILNDLKFNVQMPAFKILDVCTGSGCIALALKKELPDVDVFALDVSEEALAVANENSLINNMHVNFIKADILQTPASGIILHNYFDIIVSNPPYVLESERLKMEKKVTDYEPHLALFVKDSNPLIFYDKICEFALTKLKENGRLYFEINEAMGNDVKELLLSKGFLNIEVRKDLNGKDRMVKAVFC